MDGARPGGATARIAAFAATHASLPDAVRAVAALSILDWIAVGLAGRAEPVARMALAEAVEQGGAAQAAVFGGARLPARAAALVNGTTGHALDYDDTHFLHIGHPATVIGPAALAVAEREDASLAALLEAFAIGVEASCRIGAWLGRGHYEAGFHQTGTAGAFGATVAAGQLMGLDAARMTHALGLAATRAAGLKGQFGTMGKPLNAGFTAANGVECAALAGRGVISTLEGLEGVQGFGPTHCGAGDLTAFQGLGETWVLPEVSHKLHACCHGLHAMLEALARLRPEPATVEAVEVTVHPRWLAVCNIERPATGLEAKFSYRLTAAMALAGVDTAALETYSDAITARPDLVALRDRVRVATDPALADTAARVAVTAEGVRREAAHDLADPGPLEQRVARVRAKAASLIGADRAEAIWAVLTDSPVATPAAALAAHLA
ncbi:MAG: MmgE/PrpD family protein [Pseudomonadota bacterium]